MDKNLERILMLAEKDEYDNGGHFDEANEMDDIETLISENGLQDADGIGFLNKALKIQAYPDYVNTIIGVENPNLSGYSEANDSFEAFIVPLENGNYQVKAGLGVLVGEYDDLTKAKKAKADFGIVSNEGMQEMLGSIVSQSEQKAENYIDGKYGVNTFNNLPIKSQFVIQDYIRTGDVNEDFFDSIVNNDYRGAMSNYIREKKGDKNQFFKNVFFDGPVGENGFANLDQAKNMMSTLLQQNDPDSHQELFGEDEEISNADVEVQAQSEIAEEIQQGETAAQGGEMPKAEFTGNELVNNREPEMRAAMDAGDEEKAVEIFKEEASNPDNITPGKASHKDNPLPVAQDGTVMDKNGNPTGQTAKPGAGIYDHIDSQFKPGMSHDEVLKVIRSNHAKWRKNGMG